MKKPVPTSGADPAGTTEHEQVDVLVGEMGDGAQPDPVLLSLGGFKESVGVDDGEQPQGDIDWREPGLKIPDGRMTGGDGRMRFLKIFCNPFVSTVDGEYGRNGRIQPPDLFYIHM
jgi:hypothetical protein